MLIIEKRNYEHNEEMRAVHVVKFLPITYYYGQVSVYRLGIFDFLNELNRLIDKASSELVSKIGNAKVISSSISISQISVGPIVGVLIILYAIVEDSDYRSCKDQI